jgi:hypothetical protein
VTGISAPDILPGVITVAGGIVQDDNGGMLR